MDKRLSNEQTLNCLKLWRENFDEDALTLLASSNMALVKYIAYKYLNNGLSFDELTSAGNEALVKAINKFDYINRPIECFGTYLSRSIENGIRREFGNYNKHSHVLSFNAPIGYDKHGDEMTVEQTIGTEPEKLLNDVIDGMKIEVVKESLKCLTSRERQIIILRYGLDEQHRKTLDEIGKLFGISRQAISQIEQKALIKMRHPKNTRKLKDFND